jgi:hypothetical protein
MRRRKTEYTDDRGEALKESFYTDGKQIYYFGGKFMGKEKKPVFETCNESGFYKIKIDKEEFINFRRVGVIGFYKTKSDLEKKLVRKVVRKWGEEARASAKK